MCRGVHYLLIILYVSIATVLPFAVRCENELDSRRGLKVRQKLRAPGPKRRVGLRASSRSHNTRTQHVSPEQTLNSVSNL